ncbi:hypothetical protein H8356DRAFT_1275284 [Neocallimastix lanati (nom. inval.)]|nr:hypothetical protein H8356DRAFT_1275284 [Neocallimastix sp. JGI-2020a]
MCITEYTVLYAIIYDTIYKTSNQPKRKKERKKERKVYLTIKQLKNMMYLYAMLLLVYRECKEPLFQFIEEFHINDNGSIDERNKRISKFKKDTVPVFVSGFQKKRKNYKNSLYTVCRNVPVQFEEGYPNDPNKKRSSGSLKNHDLLYLAEVNDTYFKTFYETLMLYRSELENKKDIPWKEREHKRFPRNFSKRTALFRKIFKCPRRKPKILKMKNESSGPN